MGVDHKECYAIHLRAEALSCKIILSDRIPL